MGDPVHSVHSATCSLTLEWHSATCSLTLEWSRSGKGGTGSFDIHFTHTELEPQEIYGSASVLERNDCMAGSGNTGPGAV